MIRSYQVRVDVIRNGATLTTLQPVTPPTIDCNSTADLKMSMAGTFLKNPDINWLTDEVQPYQIIDGKEYPSGVFSAASVKDAWDANGVATIELEAYDRCLRLMQTKTETMFYIPAGTNYISAVESLLVDAGLPLFLSTPTLKTTATDREDWPIGTPYLNIINTLLGEINYDPIWFDLQGFAVIQPIKVPSASNIDHQYGEKDKLRVLGRSGLSEMDIFAAPNVFIVICDNPELEKPMIATSVNDNPTSALSVFRRGRRIVSTFKVDNTPDQETLEAYAQCLMMQSAFSEETVSIITANVPGHAVGDTVALVHPNATGLFKETSWHLILAPGQLMKHTLRRSVLL